MPSIVLFYAFLVALLTILLMIPSISRLAISIGMLDKCDEARKIHTDDIPRLGGFAIFFAFTLSAILFCNFDMTAKGMLAGGIIIFLTGLADDLTGLSPKQKFIGQFIAAGVSVLIGGQYLTTLGDLFGFGEITLGNAGIPFTIVAIVGVINAINLLDGLDGLAGGTAGIAAVCFSILAYQTGNVPLLVMLACFLGAVFGFLKFNTYPAQIFMGDSGSLFLGYCLGYFAVILVTAGTRSLSPMAPVIVLIVPIFDTLYVMVNRALSRQKLFTPDMRHLHHRLLGLNFKHQVVVTIMYGISYLFCFVAVFARNVPTPLLFYGLAGVCVLFYSGLCVVEKSGSLHYVGKYRLRISIFSERQHQRLQLFSEKLDVVLKYLLLFIIISIIIVPLPNSNQIVLVATFLMLLSQGIIFMSDDVDNRFLLFLLFFNLTYIIYFTEAGFLVITAFISPYKKDRDKARSIFGDGGFIECFVKADLSSCEKRDTKGLYRKARAGGIKEFTGISAPYEEPEHPELIIDTVNHTKQESAGVILDYLYKNGYIQTALKNTAL